MKGKNGFIHEILPKNITLGQIISKTFPNMMVNNFMLSATELLADNCNYHNYNIGSFVMINILTFILNV